ncbi:MAG TPA: hypothetical protein VFM16_07835 [Holophagaceae bacterium]|nr:hypothetical protein [Holophagaceae bacterium]
MVETLEGLGMLPMDRMEGGALRFPLLRRPFVKTAEPMPTRPTRPLFLDRLFPRGNTGIVPPNRQGNTGIVPPWRIPFQPRPQGASESKPATPLPLPAPGNTGVVPPKASAIVTHDAPVYQKPAVDEGVWTPPDDALVSDQWAMDAGVDAGLQDDLYASQDYQADSEDAGSDSSLWGLGDLTPIPAIYPAQASPLDASSSSGGFLSTLGNFLSTTLPTAAQVYASVQATKQGNPMLGAQVGQQASARPVQPMAGGFGPMAPAYGGPAYSGPSWFSERTIFPSLSNGAVVGIAAAAAVGLLVVLKKRRGA